MMMKKRISAGLVALALLAACIIGCGDDSGDGTTYTVTFDSKDGSSVSPIKVSSGAKIAKPDDPTKADNTFGGWFKEEALTTAWNFDTDTVTGNITLYARWIDDSKWRVTFDPQDGTVIPDFIEVTRTQAVGVLPIPTRVDYEFVGWFTAASGGTEYTAASVPNRPVTVYARWTALPPVADTMWRITFDARGGKATPAYIDVLKGEKTPSPLPPVKAGNEFGGWFKEAEFTNLWDFNEDTVTASIILYAKWTPGSGLVTDDPDPDDVARAEKVTLANAWYVVYIFTLPPGKTREDYKSLKASYTLTANALENAVARGARLMGPYKQERFGMLMGSEDGSAPGKGLAIASYNLKNGPYILDNTYAWAKEWKADTDDWHLKDALTDVLGVTPVAGEWFDLSYTIDGSKKHNEYDMTNLVSEDPGPFFFGLGLPGQGPSSDSGSHANTFYIRDVTLVGYEEADNVIGKPVYFSKDGYEYPAFTGYFNANGSAGHKEASREACDDSVVPVVIPVTWENPTS